MGCVISWCGTAPLFLYHVDMADANDPFFSSLITPHKISTNRIRLPLPLYYSFTLFVSFSPSSLSLSFFLSHPSHPIPPLHFISSPLLSIFSIASIIIIMNISHWLSHSHTEECSEMRCTGIQSTSLQVYSLEDFSILFTRLKWSCITER